MVPVRKPGRPLSLCPHPPSRQCGCASVTAAIPRKQTCGCGTSKPGASKDSSSAEASPAPNAPSPVPASPAVTGNSSGSFRVQKSSKASSRKASIDPASLGRIDVSQVNILPAFDARQQAQTPNGTVHHMSTPPMNGYPSIPISPHHVGPMNGMMYPFYPHQVASPVLNHSMQSSPTNGHPVNGTSQPSGSGHNPQLAARPLPNHTPGGPQNIPNSGVGTTEKKGGCCSSKPATTQAEPVLNLAHSSGLHLQQPSPGVMTPSMTPGQQYSPYYPHPTIFTYPPNYGSYLQPLLPDMWKQAMNSMMAQTLNNPNAMGTPDMGFIPTGAPTTPTLGTSHVCTCGDGCQCVGCAAHPYNDATQNYVRSAWNSMMGDAWANGVTSPVQATSHFHTQSQHGPSSNGHPVNGRQDVISAPAPSSDSTVSANAIISESGQATNGHESGRADEETKKAPTPKPAASSTPQTPSDTASGAGEEQTLSANDFFFVTYPFGGSCMGDTASCPCGDDCECLGCVVHGNNVEGTAVEA